MKHRALLLLILLFGGLQAIPSLWALAPVSLFSKDVAPPFKFPFILEELNEKLDLIEKGSPPVVLKIDFAYLTQWTKEKRDVRQQMCLILPLMREHYEFIGHKSYVSLIDSIEQKLKSNQISCCLSYQGVILYNTHQHQIPAFQIPSISSPFSEFSENEYAPYKSFIFSLDHLPNHSYFWKMILGGDPSDFQARFRKIWESGVLDINTDELVSRLRDELSRLDAAIFNAPYPANLPPLEEALMEALKTSQSEEQMIEALTKRYGKYRDQLGNPVEMGAIINETSRLYFMLKGMGLNSGHLIVKPELVKDRVLKTLEAYFFYFHKKSHSPMGEVTIWTDIKRPSFFQFQFPARKVNELSVHFETAKGGAAELTPEIFEVLRIKAMGKLLDRGSAEARNLFRKYHLEEAFDLDYRKGNGFKEDIVMVTLRPGTKLILGERTYKEGDSLVFSSFKKSTEKNSGDMEAELLLQEIYNTQLLNHPGILRNHGVLKGAPTPVMISDLVPGSSLSNTISLVAEQWKRENADKEDLRALKKTEQDLLRDLEKLNENEAFVQDAAAFRKANEAQLKIIQSKIKTTERMLATRQSTKTRHPLNFEELLSFMIQMMGMSAENHRNRIIHHDLKPSNIHLSKKGLAYLLDYGGSENKNFPYQNYGILLTPEYLTPEKISSDRLSRAQDVFQLGIIFLELISGRSIMMEMAEEARIVPPGFRLSSNEQLVRLYQYFSQGERLEDFIHRIFDYVGKRILIEGTDADSLKFLESLVLQLMRVNKTERMTASEFNEKILKKIPELSQLRSLTLKAIQLVDFCSRDLVNYDPGIRFDEISGMAVVAEMVPLLLHLNAIRPLEAMSTSEILQLWQEKFKDQSGLRDIYAWLSRVCEWHSTRHPQFGNERTQRKRLRYNKAAAQVFGADSGILPELQILKEAA